jgi:hypothetical protein
VKFRIGTPAEWRRDWQRAWWIARTHAFRCPGCDRMVPREQLRVHGDRIFCPHCDAVIIAPHGEPTGHVGAAPPPPPSVAADEEEGGVLGALGFLPAAIAGVLILYLFWMLPGMVKVALVGYLGWRPIGWEATAVTIASVFATLLFTLIVFPLAVLATRRVPGLFGTAATIAGALLPVVLFHAFIVMPWSARMNHDHDWPAELPLADFETCAATFKLGGSALSAHGVIAFEVENRTASRLRFATFTVKAGSNTYYRYTIRDVPPGARARIDKREYLGSILWRGSSDSGGQAAAAAEIVWDDVELEDGREIALSRRPDEAEVWPIPDCPGAQRPEVPWYREPYTGPR